MHSERIRGEARSDQRYSALQEAVLNGFEKFKSKYGNRGEKPNKRRTRPNEFLYIEEFRPQWKNLSVEEGLVI